GEPNYGQAFTVAANQWSYGVQLRLLFATNLPDMLVQVYRAGADGAGPYGSITKALPDGTTGTFIMEAELDIDTVEAAEGWMDFPFRVPQELSASETYWALLTPRVSGIAWTVVQGTGF